MAVVMINWINAEGDWTVRPLRWLHGAGCDVWLLQYAVTIR